MTQNLCELCTDIPYSQVIKQLCETYGYANIRSTLDELLENKHGSK